MCIFRSGNNWEKKKSLEALETFIQAQRALLARQQSDIERLRQLRIDIIQKPSQVLSNLSNEVCRLCFFNTFYTADLLFHSSTIPLLN